MGDRVRGALFNTLGDIEGLRVLDAFAGTGALSFEALSRGAASAVLIEIDRPAQVAIASNIEQLDLQDRAKLVKANCSSWSDANPTTQFDLVFAAPPYDDLQLAVVGKMVRHRAADGLFVLDWPGKTEPPLFDGLDIVSRKLHGDAQLIFYR